MHRFYRPSETLADDEVLAHITELGASDPTLANRVGKHYRVMQDVFLGVTDRVGLTNWEALVEELRIGRVQVPARGAEVKATGRQRNIRLVAVVNPQIDPGKLAQTFVALAVHEGTGSKRVA